MECLRCNAEMFTARLMTDVAGMNPYVANKKKGIFELEKRTGVSCYVCSKCGHIELVAVNPNDVKLD